jgi:hypothetical protein
MLGISLMAILVLPLSLPSSLSSNSLNADMISTSIQHQQQPIENQITRINTVFYNVTTIHPLITYS